jgi:predicted metalloprotease
VSFNDGAQLDTSQIQSGGGGGRGGIAIGGGAGLVILILGLVFGIDTSSITGSPGAPVEPGQSTVGQQCKTGADANRDVECRVVGAVNSVQAYWSEQLPRYRRQYTPAPTVLYKGATQSACGTASNQVGPFYCPIDKKVYIDASFFDELSSRFGADDGALAQEYVVAHEYGHHVQDILGVLDAAQQDPQGAQSRSVRIELMADCLAGVWANGAANTKDAQGTTYLKPLTQRDIQSALSAASAVGDDRIQKSTQGRVNPESWTHGSSEQRQRWFTRGYSSGDLNQCNTLDAASL